MDPNQLLVQFFSLPTVVFTLGIGAVIWVVRRFCQTLIPGIRERAWWNELFLPVAPPCIGAVVAYMATGYPYPEIFSKATSARVFFGLVCGFFSSKIYRIGWGVLKKHLKDKGVDVSTFESIRPEKDKPILPPPAPPS